METEEYFDRDTYEEIKDFVEYMYDKHAAHPERYHFEGFDGETNRVIDEKGIHSELDEVLLFIALAISAIHRGKAIPIKVKDKVEAILSSGIIHKYDDELLSTEKEEIRQDLSDIANFLR